MHQLQLQSINNLLHPTRILNYIAVKVSKLDFCKMMLNKTESAMLNLVKLNLFF